MGTTHADKAQSNWQTRIKPKFYYSFCICEYYRSILFASKGQRAKAGFLPGCVHKPQFDQTSNFHFVSLL